MKTHITLLVTLCFLLAGCKKTDSILPKNTPKPGDDNTTTYTGYFYGDNLQFEPMAHRTVQLAQEGTFSQERSVIAESTTDENGYFEFTYSNNFSYKVVDFDLVDNGKEAGYKTVITNIPLNKAVHDTLYVQAVTQVDFYLDENYSSDRSDSIYIYIWGDSYRVYSVEENRGKKLYSSQGRLQQEYKKRTSNQVHYSDTAHITPQTDHKTKLVVSGVLPNVSKVYFD